MKTFAAFKFRNAVAMLSAETVQRRLEGCVHVARKQSRPLRRHRWVQCMFASMEEAGTYLCWGRRQVCIHYIRGKGAGTVCYVGGVGSH